MLQVKIPKTELFNSQTEEFITVEKQSFMIEHSLLSIQKWEQKWHIRFFDDKVKKTNEQVRDYIKCMTVGNKPDDLAYRCIPSSELAKIRKYIDDPMTATTITDISVDEEDGSKKKEESFSAEVFYYMMFTRGIPIECAKWHINSLISLLRVFNFYNERAAVEADKKHKPSASYMKNRKNLNEARRRALNSTG